MSTDLTDSDIDVLERLKTLRQSKGLSMRKLAKKAGVTVSYISQVEAGRISPTLATLRKLLLAMDVDFGTFFTDDSPQNETYVFRRDSMRTVSDAGRRYVFLLPRRRDVKVEAVDEFIQPIDAPEFEALTSDIMGLVLQGDMVLEVSGEPKQILNAGDAFYVRAGVPLKGTSANPDLPVRVLTVYSPPRF